jgi:CubicO group peptidase (beta-lactamase class C family)
MPSIDDHELMSRVRQILNRHPAVGLAVGLIRGGRLEFFHGHGFADLRSGTPITEDTVFRTGSITKTVTAVAVLQLVEQGLVDLDGAAGDYLRAYRLVPARAGHRAPTVRQLLTHTAGLAQLVYPWRALMPVLGETVESGRPVPSLAEFYRGGLHLVAEPGTTHTYSNHGFATLGQIVEDVSGQPLDLYFRENIFAPLGMTDTDLVRSARVKERLATGYTLGRHGARAVGDRDLITIGAGGIFTTIRDLAQYAAAMLSGGGNEHGSVLKPETVAAMFAPQYRPDPRVPGMGLAFFRHDAAGHLIVDHDGLMPGFTSELALAVDDGVGVVAFTTGARHAMAWLGAEVSGMLRQVIGAPEDAIRTDVAQHPQVWRELCGWYALRGSLRDAQRWFIAGADVAVSGGSLTLRPVTPIPALSRRFVLHPDDDSDPYVFRIDLSDFGVGTSRVVFGREPGADATSIHLDYMPMSLDRRPAASNPWMWGAGALGALAVASTAAAVRRRRKRRNRHTDRST